jgi:membrane protease YdiL (CAAX protease family)
VADVARGVGLIWLGDVLVLLPLASVAFATGRPDAALPLRWAPLDAMVTLVGCWYFASRKYRRPSGLALGLTPVKAWVPAASAVLGVLLALLAIVSDRFDGDTNTPIEGMISSITQRPGGGLYVAALVTAMPLAEELYYRGFIYPALAARWGRAIAVAVVTLWFGSVHVYQLSGNLVAMAVVFGVGLVLTLLRAFTGSTWPGLAAHVAYNATLAVPIALDAVRRLGGRS